MDLFLQAPLIYRSDFRQELSLGDPLFCFVFSSLQTHHFECKHEMIAINDSQALWI